MARKNKNRSNGFAVKASSDENRSPASSNGHKKADPYANIESTKSAFSVLTEAAKERAQSTRFVKADAVPVGQRASDMRRNRHRSDGAEADRIQLSSMKQDEDDDGVAVVKRRKSVVSTGNGPTNGVKTNGNGDRFPSLLEKRMLELMNGRTGNSKKRRMDEDDSLAVVPFSNPVVEVRNAKIKRRKLTSGRVVESVAKDQTPYTVEHPDDDDEAAGGKKKKNKKRATKNGDFSGVDWAALQLAVGDDEDDDEDFEEQDDDDDDMSDEEVSDEENDEGEDDMESDEVDEDDVSIRPEDIERVIRTGKTKTILKRTDEQDSNDEDNSDEDEEMDDEDEEEVDDEDEEEVDDEDEEVDEENSVSGDSEGDSSDSSHVSDDSFEDAHLEDGMAPRSRELTRELPSNHSSFDNSKIDFEAFPFQDEDSVVSSSKALSWMVCPCDTQTFFADFFQSTVLVVRRNDPEYYGNLFSTGAMMTVLRENHLEYGINVNLAVYNKGVRTTPNGTGHAYPLTIADAVRTGCSVQLTNPQAFHEPIWMLCETLQETFHCFVGANTYLTPAGSAGFAPHWDEIDAFLLQVEGRKYWKVWAPESPELELPLESSRNFTDKEMEKRVPAFEGWLEQGDLLYIPRGFIHQAKTASKHHSLHVTVSCGRKWSYGNMMQTVLPTLLEGFIGNRAKARQQLPIGLMDIGGVGLQEGGYPLEEAAGDSLEATLDRHMSKFRRFCQNFTPTAIDFMAEEFMRTSLPPVLSPGEKQLSAWGNEAADFFNEKGASRITKDSEVKFIRRHGQRIIFKTKEDACVVHRMANSRVYEGRGEQSFPLTPEEHVGWTMLMSFYPDWTTVREIRMPKKEKYAFLKKLFNQGIIMVRTA